MDLIGWQEDDDQDWSLLKPDVFATVMDFYTTGQPVVSEDSQRSAAGQCLVRRLRAAWP